MAMTTVLRISIPGRAIMAHRPTMVEAVLNLPLLPAAMTLPLGPATIRRPDTANSRVSTIINAQAGKIPHSQYIAMAAMVSSLSARGSRNLPKSLTWLYFRAMWPSMKSVRLAMMKIAREIHSHNPASPPLKYMVTKYAGIRATLTRVILLAVVIS